MKLPINISHNVKVGCLWKGCIELQKPIKHNQIYIGHQGFSAVAEQKGLVHIEKGARLIVNGTARFGQGIRLWIDTNVNLIIGNNFYCNKNCFFRVFDDIIIGDDVLMGWNIELNTMDGHSLIENGIKKINHASIQLGDHIWVASHVRFTKGASIGDNSVVSSGSLVNSQFKSTNLLIGGVPAKQLKTDVFWEE